MKLDLLTLSFVMCITLVTESIVLFLQYKVDKTSAGIKWMLWGTITMAIGTLFLPLFHVKSLEILSMFANPLVVLGQIFIYVGVLQFLGHNYKEHRLGLIIIYTAFVLLYYYHLFIVNSISARTVALNAVLATIAIMTAYKLFSNKDKMISSSSKFTASVFLAYGCFLIARTVLTLIMPEVKSYSEQAITLSMALIIPNISSILFTFGYIIMLNQRLNAENHIEKEKVQLLIQQVEIERNTALINSITDSLTGLSNRRYFDDALNKEFNRLKRSDANLSLIMLDIDCFKGYNDNYGHIAGDDCLIQIGNVLKTTVRLGLDSVARYGGEEFVIILPETDSIGANTLAIRIQNAFEKIAIPYPKSPIKGYVTASIGLATACTTDLASPEQIVKLADDALYKAKKNGRNRIELINYTV